MSLVNFSGICMSIEGQPSASLLYFVHDEVLNGGQFTKDPSKLRGSVQESPNPDQVKETMVLIREHLSQPAIVSSNTSSAWPAFVSLIVMIKPLEGPIDLPHP